MVVITCPQCGHKESAETWEKRGRGRCVYCGTAMRRTRGSGGDDEKGSVKMDRGSGCAATVISCILLGLILFFGTFYTIPEGYIGVRTTFGQMSPSPIYPGLNMKLPIIQGITKMSVRQDTYEGLAETFSSDLQTVNVKYKLMVRIPKEKVLVLFKDYQADPIKNMVEPRILEVLKEGTAKMKAEEIVKNRELLKKVVLETMRLRMEGLAEVADVVIENVDLTEELEKAIERKQVMEQSALTKKYELDMQTKQAEIVVVNAGASAKAIAIEGQALRDNPQVVLLKVVEKWNGVAPLVVGGGMGAILPAEALKGAAATK